MGKIYDIEIIETHHKTKKDAPSGTAKILKENIAKVQKQKYSNIKIHSVRVGDIIGEHKVMFVAKGESIEIIHKVYSREIFAYGAILAAKFLSSQKPGLYNMQDILDLNENN